MLKREWGNIERRSVQSLVMVAASYDEALDHLVVTIKRRQQRHSIEIAVDKLDGDENAFTPVWL